MDKEKILLYALTICDHIERYTPLRMARAAIKNIEIVRCKDLDDSEVGIFK